MTTRAKFKPRREQRKREAEARQESFTALTPVQKEARQRGKARGKYVQSPSS